MRRDGSTQTMSCVVGWRSIAVPRGSPPSQGGAPSACGQCGPPCVITAKRVVFNNLISVRALVRVEVRNEIDAPQKMRDENRPVNAGVV